MAQYEKHPFLSYNADTTNDHFSVHSNGEHSDIYAVSRFFVIPLIEDILEVFNTQYKNQIQSLDDFFGSKQNEGQ